MHFTKADFDGMNEQAVEDNCSEEEIAAEYANRLFQKWLANEITVYCRHASDQRLWGWPDGTNQTIPEESALEAKLVCIKKHKLVLP